MSRLYQLNIFLICGFILLIKAIYSESHGRLIEPPSRASAWRYGFQTLPDYNDHELYCGGFMRQWKQNGGKCGECGDAWDLPIPRPHENGGKWGQGIIVRTYTPKTEIIVRVELTASHMGYFEFRLCPIPNAKQECFDNYLLTIRRGTSLPILPTDLETRFYPRNGSRIYDVKVQLPDIECFQCVFQWRYIAGNNWGICDDGNGAVGCGPQEEFRSCSDISISYDTQRRLLPMRPKFRTTMRAKTTNESTQITEVSNNNGYIPWDILIVSIFLIILCFTLWFIYRSNQKLVKERLQSVYIYFYKKEKQNSNKTSSSILSNTKDVTIKNTEINESKENLTPIRPPRTKRLSHTNNMFVDQPSAI